MIDDIEKLRVLAAKLEPRRDQMAIINDLFEAADDWRNFGQIMLYNPAEDGWDFTGRMNQEIELLGELQIFYGDRLQHDPDYLEIMNIGEKLIEMAKERRPNPDGVLGSNRIIRETFAFLQSDFGFSAGIPPESSPWNYCSNRLCVKLDLATQYGSQCRIKRPEDLYGGFELEDLLFMGGKSVSLALPPGQKIATEADVQAWFTTVANILREYGSDVLADRPGAFERAGQAAAERERLYIEECERLYGTGAEPAAAGPTLMNPLISLWPDLAPVRGRPVDSLVDGAWWWTMIKAERLGEIRGFIGGLYGPDLHAKRVDALASATLGVMTGASLAVAMIGQALAQARGLVTKHAVKQVDRLMSNTGIDVWDSFARWVPRQVGECRDILVAMDWTEFDHDSQSTLVLSLVTGHGRAAPLIWLTVWKEEIATRRNDYEDACLRRLAETLPPDCRVTILADRGFGDQKLFAFLAELGFGYVIRFRGNIRVTDAEGQSKPAAEWVGKGGRARKLRDARVTAQGRHVGAVVCVHAKGMKEPWCLAASDPEATAAVLVNHYAKRWTIEPGFRDTKDLRFGMGLSSTRIGEPTRRDRLLLVSAFAMALLTLLGTVGESLGMDRQLKSNTSKIRSHSLFRQGCMLYELIPNMPEHRLAPLMAAFANAVSQASQFSGLFAQPI